MLRSEQLEIVDPNGYIQFVEMDPALGLLNIGSHPDNDVVLDGAGVRPFHALLDFRARPYQVVFLDTHGAGETSTILDPWHSARLGGYELVLATVDTSVSATAIPAQAKSAQTMSTQAMSAQTMSAQTMSASALARPSVPVSSAQPVNQIQLRSNNSRYSLNLHNSGALPATFYVTVLDIASEWVLIEPAQCYLQPDQRTQVSMTLHPELPPGSYTLTWQIAAPDYGDWIQTGQVTLVSTVAYQSVEWAELEPRLVRSQLFRRSGRAILTLTNRSTQPVRYFLWAKDLRGDCTIHFELAATARAITSLNAQRSDQCEVLLPVGVPIPLALSIEPAEGGLIGLRTQRYRFVIQGGFNNNGVVDRAFTGTFESRPAINGGWLVLLAMVLLLTAIVTFRDQFGAWIDSWRFGQAEPPGIAVMPTPERIHGFTQEELARYRQGGTGGQVVAIPQVLPETYEEIFKEVGALYNVDWRLLAAFAYRESRLNPDAQGRSGEYGMMQILPSTWNEWAPLVQVNDPWDPYSNVLVGAAYYSYIHGYFSDIGFHDERWAIAAYNLGPERVLQILDHGARWQDIPLPQRQYTADILMGMDEAALQVARIDAQKN